MRLLVVLALLAGCAAKDSGDGGSCGSDVDHLGAELAGDCRTVGDSCAYHTWEWDFACTCVNTPSGSSWQCCSSDPDYFGYSADGCYSATPVATGWPCCGSCQHVPYGQNGEACDCRDGVWSCAASVDGGSDL